MAKLELITEQYGVDEEGTHWILDHRNPNHWTEYNPQMVDPSVDPNVVGQNFELYGNGIA